MSKNRLDGAVLVDVKLWGCLSLLILGATNVFGLPKLLACLLGIVLHIKYCLTTVCMLLQGIYAWSVVNGL